MKTKNYFLSLFVVLSIILMTSCKSEHQTKSLEKIDNMLVKVQELDDKLSDPKVQNYQQLYDTIKHYNNFFLNLPENFEETDKNLEITYRYGAVEKTFKWLHTNYLSVYARELSTSKNQIENLREDIVNKTLSEEEIDKFIHIEDSILNDIEFRIIDKLHFAQENYDSYAKYHPKVLKLIEEYDFEF